MIVAENLTYTYVDAHCRAITRLRVAVGPKGGGRPAPQGYLRTVRDVAWQAACG